MKTLVIDKDELLPVIESRAKAFELARVSENSLKETNSLLKDAKIAEMDFKVKLQQLYIDKQLHSDCRVDITTGAVTWPEGIKNNPAEDPETLNQEINVSEVVNADLSSAKTEE